MTEQRVSVEATSPASPDQVYGLLRASASYPSWSSLGRFERERPGRDDPDDVGLIRVYRTGPIVAREEVTALVPGRRIEYRLLSGLPVRDYHATIQLRAVPAGTCITWSARFRPLLPGTGWLLRAFMRSVLHSVAQAAAKAAPNADRYL